MENRLYRSRTDVILGGVCAGLGKYLHIDATLVRLFFILITLAGGIGVLAYVILWIVVPQEQSYPSSQPEVLDEHVLRERAGNMRDEFVDAVRKPNPNALKIIGIGLVVYGGYLIVRELHIPWLSWLSGGTIWAALLIIAGVVLILRVTREDK